MMAAELYNAPMKNLSALCIVLYVSSFCSAQDVEPLKYNNPGLVVDLGVGLWAWPVPADADGDGDLDLIVSCPDKPHNGVWFFENKQGKTSKHKLPVFEPAKKLSSTVHYVMPSYTDNGMKVLSPGKEYLEFVSKGTSESKSLPIPARWYKHRGPESKGPKVRHNQWRYADYNGDGVLDLICGIEDWSFYGWDDAWDKSGNWTNGKLHGFVFVFLNEGSSEKPVYPASPMQVLADGKPVDTYGCPSPNFEDFDGDGDLDLLCGEFVDGFTYFQNVGTRAEPEYAEGVSLKAAGGSRLEMELQMIVPVAIDWDTDGDIDLVVGDEDGRVALVENTGLVEEQLPVFKSPVYFQQKADTLKSGALATPVGYDWDDDGDYDIVSGNTAGYIELFENLSGPGVESPRWAAPVRIQAGGEVYRPMAGPNGSIQGPAEAKWGYTTLSIADWDADGLPDILVNGIWGRIELLKNTGSLKKPEFAKAASIDVQWKKESLKPRWMWWEPKANELVTQWRTTPVATDWDGDGLVDLVMLDHEGYLAWFRRVKEGNMLKLLGPERVFHSLNNSVTSSGHGVIEKGPGLLRLNNRDAGGSGRRKIWLADWNGDGRQDLLVNSTNANLYLQRENSSGKWTFEDVGALVERNIRGHTTSPTVVDFNADGKPDYLGGAEDGRMYYVRQ